MPVLCLRNTPNALSGTSFYSFLDVCFSHTDQFSLAKFPLPGYDVVPNGAEVLLEPYIIQVLHPERWYGYSHMDGSAIETIYRTTPEALQILKQCYQDVFLQKRNRIPKVSVDTIGFRSKWVSILEDLCFWQNNTILLGTVSHESICTTNWIDETFAKELCQLALWDVEKTSHYALDKIKLQ